MLNATQRAAIRNIRKGRPVIYRAVLGHQGSVVWVDGRTDSRIVIAETSIMGAAPARHRWRRFLARLISTPEAQPAAIRFSGP